MVPGGLCTVQFLPQASGFVKGLLKVYKNDPEKQKVLRPLNIQKIPFMVFFIFCEFHVSQDLEIMTSLSRWKTQYRLYRIS